MIAAIKVTRADSVPQTYFGMDVSSFEDPVKRKALETMVKTYGQTPKQLFTRPHSARFSDFDPDAGGATSEFHVAPELVVTGECKLVVGAGTSGVPLDFSPDRQVVYYSGSWGKMLSSGVLVSQAFPSCANGKTAKEVPVSDEISDFMPCAHAQSNILHIKYAEKTDD